MIRVGVELWRCWHMNLLDREEKKGRALPSTDKRVYARCTRKASTTTVLARAQACWMWAEHYSVSWTSGTPRAVRQNAISH
eukprot:3969643-Amphidinium_carterae.1